jgi:hypothetical protein
MIMAAAKAYRTTLHDLPKLCGPADVRQDVAPQWSMAKIDFIYECSECGAEIRQTVTKPEPLPFP